MLALTLGTVIAFFLLIGAAVASGFIVSAMPDPIPDAVLHRAGRVLDRDTLEPIGGATFVRLDGEVTIASEPSGFFSLPIHSCDLGGCRRFRSGIACYLTNPNRTSFTVRADGFEPLEVDGGLVRCDDDYADVFLTRIANAKEK